MTLEQFRRARRLTKTGLADLLGIEGVGRARTVQRYIAGLRFPDHTTIRAIEEKTGGAVSWADWKDRPAQPSGSSEQAQVSP